MVEPDFEHLQFLVNKTKNIFFAVGQAFTELESDNAKFKLKIEQEDDLIHGHLVLYHVVDADYQIQLWTSDYSTNGSNAVITVRFKNSQGSVKMEQIL
jgi:hypothetical protein